MGTKTRMPPGMAISLHFLTSTSSKQHRTLLLLFSINKILAAASTILVLRTSCHVKPLLHSQLHVFCLCLYVRVRYFYCRSLHLLIPPVDCPVSQVLCFFSLSPPEDLMTEPTADSQRHCRIRSLQQLSLRDRHNVTRRDFEHRPSPQDFSYGAASTQDCSRQFPRQLPCFSSARH